MSEEVPPLSPPGASPGLPPGPPLAALTYSLPTTPARPARPAFVTVIGAASLVVSFLSAGGSILTAVAAFLFFAGGQSMRSAAAVAVQSPAYAVPAPSMQPVKAPPDVGPEGLAGPLRQGVVDAFYAVHNLRPPRVEQLDAILARSGRLILLTGADRRAGAEPSPDRVRTILTDHGELFSRDPAAAPDFFALTTGRLELYDDRAVFHPSDGSATIRSAYGRQPSHRALTESEVQAVLTRAGELTRRPLNDAQRAAVARALAAADQTYVTVPPGGDWSEPKSVTRGAGGAVSVRFGDGVLHLGPQGESLGTPPAPAAPPAPDTAAFLVVEAASVAGLLLAIVLFVAAVLWLRGLPAGRRLHLAWAWVKIPVAAVAGVTFWWMAGSFYDAMADFTAAVGARLVAAPGSARFMAQPWQPVAAAIVSLAYPLVVLVVMRGKAVRAYYQPPQ